MILELAIAAGTVVAHLWVRRSKLRQPKPQWCRAKTCAARSNPAAATPTGNFYKQVWAHCVNGFCDDCCRVRGCRCYDDEEKLLTPPP